MSVINDTIVALSTPQGSGALALIRVTGDAAWTIVNSIFSLRKLKKSDSHRARYGTVVHKDGTALDDCIITAFKSPKSFTGEDMAEISCHGSPFIIREIIELICQCGARLARPGEFSQRAYFNGKMDLTQAEAVADLIASQSASQHQLAMYQMKGGISNEIEMLRSKLIEFASLIELENDFGEEDVEFADRKALTVLASDTIGRIDELESTFYYGKAIKDGVAVAIVGPPNVGKSTLLNVLLSEEKAIVSSIPGTTRDVIEDSILIDGILFRFIDTAGIHETKDEIESIGISRSLAQIERANIILFVQEIDEDYQVLAEKFREIKIRPEQKAIVLLNKYDQFHACHGYDVEEAVSTLTGRTPTLAISAKDKTQLDKLRKQLVNITSESINPGQQVIISTLRHMEALRLTRASLQRVVDGLTAEVPSDLIAMDIRHALHHLGEIAGVITTDDLLDNIFSNFCIGK